jgi:CelD/BcsL family acetyltransferase involved in cellulose biosynthesis
MPTASTSTAVQLSVRAAGAEEWDALWSASDGATFFHSRAWAEAWSGATRGKLMPAGQVAELAGGARVLLPLSRRERLHGLVSICHSSPAGTYGGWVAPQALAPEQEDALAERLDREHRALYWRWNPFQSLPRLPLGGFKAEETLVLRAGDGFAPIAARWRSMQDRKLRKAQREGVRVRLAASEEDWERHFQLYEESLARWGERATSRYGREVLAALRKHAGARARLWLAECGGELAAGALCFESKRHVAYWHGAASAKLLEKRPANLLLAEAVRDACERGFWWFDFNPSAGLEGVRAFKRSFGAEPLPCPMLARGPLRAWTLAEAIR